MNPVDARRHCVSRRQRRALKADNRKASISMTVVPFSEWPDTVTQAKHRPAKCWRSKDFIAMLFDYESARRITIYRTSITGGDFDDGITWDELQLIKRQCGFGDECAIEIFPPDRDLVNVANMRHLWLVEPPKFLWRSRT